MISCIELVILNLLLMPCLHNQDGWRDIFFSRFRSSGVDFFDCRSSPDVRLHKLCVCMYIKIDILVLPMSQPSCFSCSWWLAMRSLKYRHWGFVWLCLNWGNPSLKICWVWQQKVKLHVMISVLKCLLESISSKECYETVPMLKVNRLQSKQCIYINNFFMLCLQSHHHIWRTKLCVCRRCPMVRPSHIHNRKTSAWDLLWDAGAV